MTYGVYVEDDDFFNAYKWCETTFDSAVWTVDIEPMLKEEFLFDREEDATMFRLRWAR